MPGGIGLPELVIVLVIVLLIFGPKKLPGVGKSLGTGLREFKDSVSGDKKDEPEQIEPRREPIAPVAPAQATPEPEPASQQQSAPADEPARREPTE